MVFSRRCMILFMAIAALSLAHGIPEQRVPSDNGNLCSGRGFCGIDNDVPKDICLPEWEGERCELPREYVLNDEEAYEEAKEKRGRFDECLYFPGLCENGGLCVFNQSLSCVCPFTHIGSRCEIVSPCFGYCKNGGVCRLVDKVVSQCNCTGTGFIGVQCNVPETSPASFTTTTTAPNRLCVALKPYCNGGDCRMDNGVPVCVCPTTRTGRFCEIDLASTTRSTAPFVTTLPTNPPGVVVTTLPTNPPGVVVTTLPTNPPGVVVTTLPTNPPGVVVTPQPGVTCAANPCRNLRPCYPNGNSYFCFCGSQYTGVNCEFIVGK